MYKPYFIILLLFFGEVVFSQDTCDTAIPFCSTANSQDAIGNGSNAQIGPDYGCLLKQQNPFWSFLKVETDGDLELEISLINASGDGIDIDFICYGPFTDTTTLCETSQLTAATTVACGYSPTTTETATISGALTDEHYLILITRSNPETGTLTFSQTNLGDPGAGELACDIICTEIPEFEVSGNLYQCNDGLPLVQTFSIVSFKDVYTYSWTDENDVEVSNVDTFSTAFPGVYTVTATSTTSTNPNCIQTKTVELISAIPAKITNLIIDEHFIERSSSITIEITGRGTYQYALNDVAGPYQDEPYFTDIPPGIHEVFVKEINGCGITSKVFNLFGYYPFFTPNGDGIHDTWKVEGIIPNSIAKIYIFDRFGKLMSHFSPALGESWDGLYRNKPAPETDYWFSAEMVNYNGKSVIRKGHFSLIRRYN